jgi:hypothetical protein
MASSTSAIAELGVATLSDEAWAQARHRAEIIGPLAVREVIGHEAADAAAQALGLSRRQMYVLIRRARQGKTPPLWISCTRRLPKRESPRNFCHIMSLSDPLRF